ADHANAERDVVAGNERARRRKDAFHASARVWSAADDLDRLAVTDVDHAYAEAIGVWMFFGRDHRRDDKWLELACLVLDVLNFKPDHRQPVDDLGQRRVGVEVLFQPGQREFHRAAPLARSLAP